jgi:hypothetical protein
MLSIKDKENIEIKNQKEEFNLISRYFIGELYYYWNNIAIKFKML